jgi:hypothetical protein
MEAVALSVVPDPFHSSLEMYCSLTKRLSLPETVGMKHSDLEKLIERDGRELMRRLLQDHLNLRGKGDIGSDIKGSDGVERTHKRVRERGLTSIFGGVQVERTGYSAREESSLFPQDSVLNMPKDSFSHGMRKAIAIEAARGSFDEAMASVERMTGVHVSKRQAEGLAAKSAQDFDAFYAQGCSDDSLAIAKGLPLQILSMDSKGIVMRKEDLKQATRLKAQESEHKLKKRVSKGEKLNAKRMATVAAVYSIDTFIRTPEQVSGEFAPERALGVAQRPRPMAKRVWASIEKEQEAVIEDLFSEALSRDPKKRKQWVCLVDGERRQLKRLRKAAKKHGVEMVVVLDIIHVIEYLWKAARVFHEETSAEAEKWVSTRLLQVLRGNSSHVAAGMRRSATLRKIPTAKRKPIDVCAGYMLRNSPYLNYDEYLKNGFPIATGVIEGACRHVIKDRMDVTGARWSLTGSEAVLRLRSLRASGDFEDYWDFHENQEHARNHKGHYAKPSVCNKLRLKLVQTPSS